MTENWVITPPNSPTFFEDEQSRVIKPVEDLSQQPIRNDWAICMFHCSGEVNSTNLSFHNESFISGGEYLLFIANTNVLYEEYNDKVKLFGYTFDKGSAFLRELKSLFSITRCRLMQLDAAARLSVKSFAKTVVGSQNVNFRILRHDVAEFFIYVRNYIQRVCSNDKYFWIMEKQLPDLLMHLYSVRLLLGTANNLPDYVVNYSAISVGNKCTQPSYHLFHCHLDVRWLHLTVIYQLANYTSLHSSSGSQSQLYTESPSINFKSFEDYVLLLTSDLVIFALKRFQQMTANDLLNKSTFTCTCVRELWKLLQLCTDCLSEKNCCQPFWHYVNEICNVVLYKEEADICDTNCSSLSLPKNYSCNNRITFIFWLLKDLSTLYDYHNVEIAKDNRSNYQLLENAIKQLVAIDVPEVELRICLKLTGKILKSGWEMKTEPFIWFWEYFHKRLNSHVHIPDSSISDMAIISKSALGLLVQTNARLSSGNKNQDSDSFQLFLRLLGMTLKKWHDNPRFWNQIKGRIFSKFSFNKMASLTEIGLYNFISLFLTLTISADLEEVGSKFQSFLKLLSFQDLDKNLQELILKAHISLVILFAENNNDISVVSNPVLDIVDYACLQNDHLKLMRIFVEGFQDLIDCTHSLELGQYMYINTWIGHYISNCTESDNHRLLELLLSLTNKFKSALPNDSLTPDSQLFLLFEALWEHTNPILKKTHPDIVDVEQIADFAASLTALTLSPALYMKFKLQGSNLFNTFMISESIDSRLLCRYLNQLCASPHLRILNNHDMMLIKGWLRCCVVLSGGYDSELRDITKYVIQLTEMRQIIQHDQQCILTNSNNIFKQFLNILLRKYLHLQDVNEKIRFRDQICSYFFGIEKWLLHSVKVPKSAENILQIYRNVSLMMEIIPGLLYIKSKANNIFQCLMDLLLLPPQIRNSDYKLHPYIASAVWNTLDRFINGLVKLGPKNDFYISRSIKELVTIYVPRFATTKGLIPVKLPPGQFSLLRCFKDEVNSDMFTGKLLIEIICDNFLKRKQKVPDSNVSKALQFIFDVAKCYRYNNNVIVCIISQALHRICDILMYCDVNNSCRILAKEIVNFILTLDVIYSDWMISDEVMKTFEKLCTENLAFSARLVFDLFIEIAKYAPNLISTFLPRLTDKVKEVETKRGVGFDRSLRKGIEHVENALNSANRG